MYSFGAKMALKLLRASQPIGFFMKFSLVIVMAIQKHSNFLNVDLFLAVGHVMSTYFYCKCTS